MTHVRYIALAFALAAAQSSYPATVSLTPSKDNSIFQSGATDSAGGSPGIHVGANSQGSPRRGLIAFDVAPAIPPGSTITAVQLRMYLGSTSNANAVSIGLHKLSKDWGEGNAGASSLNLTGTGNGFPASDGDATWRDAMLGSVAWSSPGADGDFNPVPSATAVVSGAIDLPQTWI